VLCDVGPGFCCVVPDIPVNRHRAAGYGQQSHSISQLVLIPFLERNLPMEHHPGGETRDFSFNAVRADKVRREGDGSIDEDMEPGVSIIADVSPITRKHADMAISKLKSIIKDDILHQKGKFA
jgi:hypothetical protein